MPMGLWRIGLWRALSALGSIGFVVLFFPLYGTLTPVQVAGAAAVLALVGYGADRVVLSRWNGWIAAVVDFFLAWAVVYGLPLAAPGTRVTATFAILCGWLYAFTEWLVHQWLYRRGDWEGPGRAEAGGPGP